MIIDKVLLKIARMTNVPRYAEDIRGGVTTTAITRVGTGVTVKTGTGVTIKRD